MYLPKSTQTGQFLRVDGLGWVMKIFLTVSRVGFES